MTLLNTFIETSWCLHPFIVEKKCVPDKGMSLQPERRTTLSEETIFAHPGRNILIDGLIVAL